MTGLTLYTVVGYIAIVAATIALPLAVWRLALSRVERQSRVLATVAAAGAPLVWLSLGIGLVASRGALFDPSVFLALSFAVGLWAGAVIGHWGAVLLPLALLPPTVLGDALREQLTTASGLTDPAPPVTILVALLVVPALALAVSGGVAWRRLRERPGLDS